ncbi:OST-HTH/LOTUS domain,Tudor domain [Cinara cedri]|uniref:OST-HTH/LOTUS domain,Tudor domain n=1 Tax=Cinara cedri TaxID=506608 RepID=A0A5E4N008_9HEMI|nr:OST-HTH/LOTUS domain,Tudor domain [Cinara cedri]
MSDLDNVYINLRACLVSCKGGIPLNDIENEYFKLNGERIAYRRYGFSSLENLLQSSDKFTIQNCGGISIVQASTTQKTQHLTDLIKKQKSKPLKKLVSSRGVSRNFNTSGAHNRFNNYSRQGNVGPPRNRYNGTLIPNNTYGHKSSVSHNFSRNKPHPINNYSRNANNYHRSHQPNSGICVTETKIIHQNNQLKDNINYFKSNSTTNGTHSLNINGKSHTKPELKHNLTSSCSSLESTYSSSSTSYTSTSLHPKHTSINSRDNVQIENEVRNTVSQININDKGENQRNNIYTMGKNSEFKHPPKQHHHQQQPPPILKYPSPNMALKPSTAQSRLQKYPKKCDETLNKIDEGVKNLTAEEPVQSIEVEDDPCLEVNDNNDYVGELESYLINLNLPEPYYDCMIKKEKHGKKIRHIHMCTVKVIDKSSSSYPVECKTVDCAKQVAAKKIITILKNHYGENMAYPITSDINMMAVRIKEFLKSGFERNGLMGDKLEEMYREKFQENLPDNWVQLLEVYSYFTFDKLVANKIIIYMNEMDSDYCQNSHANINGYPEAPIEEQNIIPGTPLTFEDYEEKSILVSANYGATNIWIRFVGQNADENFIQMQAKFNDTMNTTSVSIAEQVIEGEYYAVLYNSTWHRVQISSSLGEDGTVTCFMVDTGELYNVSKDQICNLEPVFMKTKLQAIECILSQFDNFGTFDGLRELLNEMILNKTFFVVPDSLEDGARVTLYEKGETCDRINVNNMIIQRFLEKTIVKLPSFEEHTVVDGIVSSFVESGHLYLQLNFDVISSLEEILPNDECLSPEYFLKNKEDIGVDQVYLMKYENDNLWCRVQVIEIINDSEVKVIYIDYGNIAKCEINKLVNLELFDPLMAMIPPQALKVSMNLLPPSIMTSEIAKKLFDIIGNDKVLVNVINAPINDVPCIQLYKTESTEETALCINIQMAKSLKKQ